MRPLARAALVVALALLAPRAGAAERPTVALQYAASPECPPEATFRELLAARLGFDPVTADGRLQAAVELQGGQGRVQLADAGGAPLGERRLVAADCTALASSAALALAIAIDPQLFARKPAPVAPTPAPVAAPAPPPTTEVTLAVGPALLVGLLPGAASGGLDAEVLLRRGVLSVSVGAQGAFSAPFAVDGGEIATSAFRASLGVCANLGPAALCARSSAGALRAEGQGFSNARRATLALWSAGPLARVQRAVWRGLVVGATAGLDVAVLRAGLTLGDVEVWRASVVAADFGAYLGWAL